MAFQSQIIEEDFERQRQEAEQQSEGRRKYWLRKVRDTFAYDYFRLCLDTSSIHGLNHLTKFQRHPVEIILWLLVVIGSVYGSINLNQSTWYRYQFSPTVISMDRDMYAWNTTFPSVTLCPHNKINEKKLALYLKTSKEPNKTALEEFIMKLASATYTNFGIIPLYDMPTIPSSSYMELLLNLSWSFTPTLTIGASGIHLSLEPTITEMGLCYAVNSRTAIYNSPAYWAANRWDLITNPNATFFVHPLDGEVFAQIINMSTSYDVFIHGPSETPDVAAQNQSSDNGYYMKLYVTAVTVYTAPEAAELSVSQRKCRFPRDNELKHSAVYSYNLCRMECRIRLCLQFCKCLPHFYRRIGNETVCDPKGLRCLATHEDTLFKLHDEKTGEHVCECLPLCDDVNYVVQSRVLQEWFLGTNLQWGMVTYPRLRYRRDVIFGFTDVLVSVGGMAGLFLGCSVLSFMEIIYFITLRLFWYIMEMRRAKNHNL